MKKKIKKLNITWITVWLVITALAFTAFVGYATYTGVTAVKRVASTRPGAGVLFSSNYMKHGTKSQVSIEYGDYSEFLDNDDADDAADQLIYNMVVCNYSQGDKATWYTANDIKYTVVAQLFLNEKYTSEDVANGVSESLLGEYKTPTAADIGLLKFGIKYSDDDNYTYFSSDKLSITLPESGNYSLSKNTASTDTFSLLFDKSELKNNNPRFWIKVTATPTSISGGEVEMITGYVGTCRNAQGGASWSGYIEDDGYSNVDYDSYNYIISGNGKGTFYFAWDDSKVKPNEFALLNYKKVDGATVGIDGSIGDVSDWSDYKQYGRADPPPSGTWKYIKLDVDSDQTARYEIQLYKTSGADYSSVIEQYTDYYFIAEQVVGT